MIPIRPAKAYAFRLMVLVICGTLLAGAAFGQQAGDQARDLRRVRLDQEANPRLRLNTGGHTAVVRGLAFLPDSQRLCSAGLDKNVEVWNLKTVFRDLRRVFLRERTIRWQVARGLRGSIYAIDAAPSDGLLAIGGYGAMGSTGEILLVSPLDGSLAGVLERHRQTVSSLAFSADGNWLASIDLDGRATLWKRQGWQPAELDAPDPDTYGTETARRIAASTDIRPITIAASTQAILPRLAKTSREGSLEWQLRVVDLADPTRSRLLETVHRGMVTALAASRDGRRLASADLEGHLYLWDLQGNQPPRRLDPGAVPISLCFSPDGKTLALGTAVRAGGKESEVQLWDVGAGLVKTRLSLPDHVWACRISPDGEKLAHGGGKDNEVFVRPIANVETAAALRGTASRVLKVAFEKAGRSHRFGFGWDVKDRGFNDYADIQAVFDPEKLQLERAAPPAGDDWLTAEAFRGDWQARRRDDGNLQLYRGPSPAGSVELDPVLEGRARCYCWIPGGDGRPAAIAVGTDGQNSIHVLKLAAAGPCPILRQFRGHADYVTSVGASSDGRYLVSGSADGTVCLWSLESFERGATALGRWGAELSVKNNQLVATEVLPSGPLFAKGLRQGDVLSEIRWPVPADQGAEQSESRPEAIQRRLEELPWMTQVRFDVASGDGSRTAFQRVPAWQPLATLFASTDGQWAYWTPEGYYDASVNGHTLFGWQVNRGLHALPDFYRADQYQKTLERPAVMGRLLSAGSLQKALDEAAEVIPEKIHQVLPRKIAATPSVEILSPRPGTVIQEGSTRVTARISTPEVSKLVQARVFANGVVATQRRVLQQRALAGGSEVVYEWTVPLPADERTLIQLIVATDAPTGAFSNVVVDRGRPAGAEAPPRLYLLAVGINQYADSEVPSLSFSVADAKAITDRMKSGSEKLYELENAALLSDSEVTPASWRAALEQIAGELKKSSRPDDLLVVFMAGHGLVDTKSQTYYYLGHQARLDAIDSGDFRGCISWKDFHGLADVPCRKLVVLDTCHSGAIQPLQDQGLKTGLRALQEDVVLAVAASAGHEKAAELKTLGHGVFTKCLLEALSGRADDSGDGMVTLDEVVAYVTRSVAEATAGRQNPSAGPGEILPFVTLPLARVNQPATGQ